MRSINNNPIQFACILLVSNLALKFYSITYGSFDLDEAWHVFFSQKPFLQLLKTASEDPNPPFYNILIGLWIKLFGVSEIGTRSLSVVLSSLTAPLIFLFARKNLNIQTAIYSSLLFSVSNVHLFYAHDSRVYALVCFLTVLSFICFFEILKNPNVLTFSLYTLINTSLLYTHLVPAFAILAQFIAALLFIKEYKKGVISIIISQAAACILFAPWLLFSPYYQKKASTWLTPPDNHEIKELFITYFNSETLWNNYILLAICFIVVVLWKYIKHQEYIINWKSLLVLALWGILPIIVDIIVSHTIIPIFLTRYMLFSSIGLFLLAGYLISIIPVNTIVKIGFVVFLVSSSFFSLNFKTFKGEDWRGAVSYVKKYQTDSVLVLVSPFFQYVSFAYYYAPEAYKDYDHTLDKLGNSNVYFYGGLDILNRIDESKFKRIMLVTSHEGVVDPASLTAFLTAHYKMAETSEFASINCYIFDVIK